MLSGCFNVTVLLFCIYTLTTGCNLVNMSAVYFAVNKERIKSNRSSNACVFVLSKRLLRSSPLDNKLKDKFKCTKLKIKKKSSSEGRRWANIEQQTTNFTDESRVVCKVSGALIALHTSLCCHTPSGNQVSHTLCGIFPASFRECGVHVPAGSRPCVLTFLSPEKMTLRSYRSCLARERREGRGEGRVGLMEAWAWEPVQLFSCLFACPILSNFKC